MTHIAVQESNKWKWYFCFEIVLKNVFIVIRCLLQPKASYSPFQRCFFSFKFLFWNPYAISDLFPYSFRCIHHTYQNVLIVSSICAYLINKAQKYTIISSCIQWFNVSNILLFYKSKKHDNFKIHEGIGKKSKVKIHLFATELKSCHIVPFFFMILSIKFLEVEIKFYLSLILVYNLYTSINNICK